MQNKWKDNYSIQQEFELLKEFPVIIDIGKIVPTAQTYMSGMTSLLLKSTV